MNMFQSENLKFKRTFSRNLCFIAPMYVLILSLWMNQHFFTNTINWWSAFFYPFVICLVCVLSAIREKKAGSYRTLKSKDIDLKKMWISKILVISYHCLIASLILMLNYIVVKLIYISYNSSLIPIGKAILGIFVIWLTTLILIPICLFVAEAFGTFTAILVTSVGFILGILLVDKSLWFLSPCSLNIRLLCPILNLNPNGCLLEAGDPLLDPSVISTGIIIGIVGFIVLSVITSFWFAKKEAR